MTIEINFRPLIAMIAFAATAIATALGTIDHLIAFATESHAMAFCIVNATGACISFTLAFNRKH